MSKELEIESSTSKQQPAAEGVSTSPSQGRGDFEDNRPEVSLQRKLKKIANEKVRDHEPIQRKVGDSNGGGSGGNSTGLPAQLKSGVESLSGHSMDDVSVHYNSDKPAQLNAHAYAQGTDIHLGPGQEKHLPHEAWHVVQQKQGRVKPTAQMKSIAPINDDPALEQEADTMGAKALDMPIQAKWVDSVTTHTGPSSLTLQRVAKEEGQEKEIEQSYQATIETEMVVLRGQSSFWGWLTNSNFTQLSNAVKLYEKEYAGAPVSRKIELIESVFEKAQQYLKEHKDDGSENDKLRRQSIEKVASVVGSFKDNWSAAVDKLAIAQTDDKVGLGAKLKKALFGQDTPFVKAVKAFTDYQNQVDSFSTESSEDGMKFLEGVFAKAKRVKESADAWEEAHKDVTTNSSDFEEKKAIIDNMRSKLGSVSVSLKLRYQNYFKFTGEQVKIDPLDSTSFSSKSFKVQLLDAFPEPLRVAAEVHQLQYVNDTFDFERIVLSVPGQLINFSGLSFSPPATSTLTKNGNTFTFEVSPTSLELNAGSLFQASIQNASGAFKFNSGDAIASMKLAKTLNFGKIALKSLKEEAPAFIRNREVAVIGLTITPQGNGYAYDFRKIITTAPPEAFTPFSGLTLSSPQSVALSKDGPKYQLKIGNAGIKIDENQYFEGSAYGSAQFNYVDGNVSTFQLLDKVHVNQFTGKLGSDFPDFLNNVTVTGEGISILGTGNGYDVDFQKLTLTKPPSTYAPFGESLKLSPPNVVEVTGPKADYRIDFKGSEAALGLKYFNGKAAVNVFKKKNEGFGVSFADIELSGETPTVPGDLTSLWPIEFTAEFTFLPAPVTASIGFEIDGGVKGTMSAKGTYVESGEKDIKFNGSVGVEGELGLGIKAGVGVGHSWLVYAGVFGQANATAVASGSASLDGYFTYTNDTFALGKATLTTDLSAALKASLSAGVEAKALGIFKKKLYEVKSKDWDLGQVTRHGVYNYKEGEGFVNEIDTGTGVLGGDVKTLKENIDANEQPIDGMDVKTSQASLKQSIDLIHNALLNDAAAKHPEGIHSVRDRIAGVKEALKYPEEKLQRLLPTGIVIFKREQLKEVKSAMQLLEEVKTGHLENLIAQSSVDSPDISETMTWMGRSLNRIFAIIEKYDK
jgi:hypothetical protein